MESEKKWYVIHTYSGYENKVKTNLERKVQSMGMEDEIFNVVVPMEDDVEVRDGRKKVMKKKVFPGYALVEMIVNDRSWYVVRNTPGVTGFVGSGTKPIPLTDSEVKRILRTASGSEELRPVLDVEPGQAVHIHSGAFENFPATVTEVDQAKGKLKALVDMFGRETVVELDFDQVEKI
ncbi:transcription termination/antitermination protein NusG [Schwartzia sp. (in: firmicutes)]